MKMKHLLTALLICLAALSAEAKSAILIAHYGSSDSLTRAVSISLITAETARQFPSMTVREAYISPVVRKRLAKAGQPVPSPTEALLSLAAERFDTVYVQPTTIIDGSEMAEVRESVERMAGFFSKITLGNSLCHSPADCLEVAQVLTAALPAGETTIYVGHGNLLPSTATYAQLDMMTSLLTSARCRVSTIEGYPDAEATAALLAASRAAKRVRLIPFLLICGNHTREDIAGTFADTLRAHGYRPEVTYRGLAESPAIRAIYISRIKKLTQD